MAVCGMKCTNLSKEIIKTLGIHFLYSPYIHNEINHLNTFLKAKEVLRLWRIFEAYLLTVKRQFLINLLLLK